MNGRVLIDGVGEPVQGYTVHMIGAVSGRVSGSVIYPCANTFYSSRGFLCVAFAAYRGKRGDSGAPVVELHGDGTTGWAVGVHFAGYDNWQGISGWASAFGRMAAILDVIFLASSEQYFLDPTTSSLAPPLPPNPPPPSHWAIISGTSSAAPDMTCHWYSGSNIEDASVEWYANGVAVGTSYDLYYSSASSFTLQVKYFGSWAPDSKRGTRLRSTCIRRPLNATTSDRGLTFQGRSPSRAAAAHRLVRTAINRPPWFGVV